MPKTLPKETAEIVALAVEVNGVPTTDYEVALVPFGEPTIPDESWHAPDVAGSKRGIMVEGQDQGRYWVFVRYEAAPELPVRCLDYIVLV